jgi:hypothetical protein
LNAYDLLHRKMILVTKGALDKIRSAKKQTTPKQAG